MSPRGPRRLARWRPHAPRTLTSRLVATAVLLVAVVSVLVATVTAFAVRDQLTGQLDAKVRGSVSRVADPPDGGPPEGAPSEPPSGSPELGNQEPGTLVALVDDDRGFVLTDVRGDDDTLSQAALDVLDDVPADGEVHAVDVPGEGSYRVAAETDQDGRAVVIGLPTRDVDASVASLVRWEALLVLLGVAVAAGAGLVVVRRQLRPLTEVAHTAHVVAELPLEQGEIGITERVPARLTDVRTEVGQVGAALNTLLAHVETSLDARHRSEQQVRQFVADASHELRTPLTTIAGYTELARRRGDPEATTTALAKVEEEAARMTALVEDLLLLARLDAGRPLERQPVDLTRLLVEAVDDARVVAPDHRWRLVLPEDGEEVEVLGDAPRLHQVVTNLLGNARKYAPPGSTVTTTVRPGGFDVHDDGPGFAPELVDVAFERFTRGDASRHRAGGVGLGLALVEAIVSAHGGDVRLRSTPGDTRISVDLGYAEDRLSDNLTT